MLLDMLSLAFSAAMLGIEGYVVRVEADSSAGTPGFALIGLPVLVVSGVDVGDVGSPSPSVLAYSKYHSLINYVFIRNQSVRGGQNRTSTCNRRAVCVQSFYQKNRRRHALE